MGVVHYNTGKPLAFGLVAISKAGMVIGRKTYQCNGEIILTGAKSRGFIENKRG
jgi:hypothetical protein